MKLILALIAIIGAVLANPAVNKLEKTLKNIYKDLDANHDGKVTETEFVDYFKQFDKSEPKDGLDKDEFKTSLPLAPELVDDLWREFNNNNDEVITYDELKADYQEFDINDDSELSEVEFVEAIVLGIIFHDEIDSGEKDGKVTEKEFVDFFLAAAGEDKILTAEELKTKLSKYPEQVVEKLYKELDDNNDGNVNEAELKTNFEAFNDNNDDHLTVEEFRNAVSNGPIGQLFKKLDQDDNGQLTADEIVTVLDKPEVDGKITEAEAAAVLKGIPEELVKKFFNKLDTDATKGEVTKEEVAKFVDDNDKSEPKDHALNWLEFQAALAA